MLNPLFMLFFHSFSDVDIKVLQAQATGPISGYKTFSDSENGIKIQYPNDWAEFDRPFLDMMTSPVPNVTIVTGFHPPDPSVAVVVSIEPQSKNLTLEEEMNDTIQNLKKNQQGLELIESNKTLLSGIPAYKLHYTGTFNVTGINERFNIPPELAIIMPSQLTNTNYLIYMTVTNGSIYGISYEEIPMSSLFSGGLSLPDSLLTESPSSDTESKFSKYLPVIQKMVNSFEITPSGQENNDQQPTPQVDDAECKDHLKTLASRLVSGEIDQQEFKNIKNMIGC